MTAYVRTAAESIAYVREWPRKYAARTTSGRDTYPAPGQPALEVFYASTPGSMVDITGSVRQGSVTIESTDSPRSSSALFDYHTATAPLLPVGDVAVYHEGQRIFAGRVRTTRSRHAPDVPTQWWSVACQDYTTLLGQNTVHWLLPATVTGGDRGVIRYLFDQFCTWAISTTAHVAQIEADWSAYNVEEQFHGKTLAECLVAICQLTGGTFYVDGDRSLHYYATSSPQSTAPKNFSDAPGVGEIAPKAVDASYDGLTIINAAYADSERPDDATVVPPPYYPASDSTSISTYGYHERYLGTFPYPEYGERSAPVVAAQKDPAGTISVTTDWPGFAAGQTLTFEDSVLGISSTSYRVRRAVTRPVSNKIAITDLELGTPVQSVADLVANTVAVADEAWAKADAAVGRWRFVRITRETLRSAYNPPNTNDVTETSTSIPTTGVVAVALTVGIRESTGANVSLAIKDYGGSNATTAYTSGVAGRGGFVPVPVVLTGGTNNRQFKWAVNAWPNVDVWIYVEGYWTDQPLNRG